MRWLVSTASARLRRWAAPPVFDNLTKTRMAATLNAFLLLCVGAWVLISLIVTALGTANAISVSLTLAASVAMLSLRVVMQRGHLEAAAGVAAALMWGVTTGVIYAVGTLATFQVVGYLMVAAASVWLLRRRWAAALCLACVAAIAALGYAEGAGMLPPPTRPPIVNGVVGLSAYLVSVAILMRLIRRELLRALTTTMVEIARRTKVQAALQRTQDMLTEAERIAHVGSWERVLATKDDRFSDEMFRVYGFQPGDPSITMGSFWRVVHPDDYSALSALFTRLVQTGEPVDSTFRSVTPSGETRVLRAVAEAACDASGRPVRIYGMTQDITEQSLTRQALDQRMHDLLRLHDLSRPISLDVGLDELAEICAERMLAYAGLDMARIFVLREGRLQLAGMSSSLAEPPAEAHSPVVGECVCGAAAREGQLVYCPDVESDALCTRSHCHAAGARSLAALPLRREGNIIGVLAVGATKKDAFAGRLPFLETAADVIAIRLHNALLHQEVQWRAAGLEETVAERTRELLTERNRTQAILETVGESVIVTDLDGRVLFLNPAWSALTGYAREDELGQPIFQRWTAPTRSDIWPPAQEALRSGRAWQGEITGQRKDGTTYIAALTGMPLFDPAVGPGSVGAVWVQRDITELKEAARLKDQFASNVSHELRTPISIIALSCDNLQAFYERMDAAQRRAVLQDIREQARRLGCIVEDTLLLSQVDAGRAQGVRRRLDLTRLVRSEVESQQPFARQRSQTIGLKADLPVMVMGNEVQLTQVVRNILDNAIKYTPAGGRIACTCETRMVGRRGDAASVGDAADWAVVEIADSGVGISPEHVPLLFERFFRASYEGDVPGAGLGLPIARSLTMLHGGWIAVDSAPGKGSTFTVYLPLAAEPGAREGARLGEHSPAGAPRSDT